MVLPVLFMMKQYKIYFNKRFIVLQNTLPENPEQKYSLFYKYNGRKELYRIIRKFEKNKDISSLLLVHNDLKKLWKKFKGYFRYIKAGGGFVQNELGAFLAIRRRGVWDLPKGKKSKKESIQQAALREVSEESGLQTLEIVSHLHTTFHTYSLNHEKALKKTKWYVMRSTSEEKLVPEKREKITEVKWVHPDKADEIIQDTYSSIADVIKAGLEI